MRKTLLSVIIFFAVLSFIKVPVAEAQQTAFSCDGPGIKYSFNENNAAVVVAIDKKNLDPTETYYGVVVPTGDPGSHAYSFPLGDSTSDNTKLVGGTTFGLPTVDIRAVPAENYTVYIARDHGACGPINSPYISDKLRKNLNLDVCKAYGADSCATQFLLNRADKTNYSANVDPYDLAEKAVENVGKIYITPYSLCQQIPVAISTNDSEGQAGRASKQTLARDACCKCATGNDAAVFDPVISNCSYPGSDAVTEITSPNLYTAVGCIPTTPESIIKSVVRIGLGIAGGVALLMILSGAFMYTTSQGEPKRTGEAREMITSAVMGLIFIIFSVVILRFIGVSVLQIPGFG